MKSALRVCLLGFGEVGRTMGLGLHERVLQLAAWDLKFTDPASSSCRAAEELGVLDVDARSAVAAADLVICAVTAAQMVAAASSVAPYLKNQAFFLDLNSASPLAKSEAAAVIESAGGRFVEAALMSPIAPLGVASPMLIGGAHAREFLPLAQELGFTGVEVFSEKLGAASAAKMCRSVIVKGIEALLLEALLTARSHGVEAAVLDSLPALFSVGNWHEQSRYMISRALIHGRRRAEEMSEVARTVSQAGLTPRMSSASAAWQEWAALQSSASSHDLPQMLDRLLAVSLSGGARC